MCRTPRQTRERPPESPRAAPLPPSSQPSASADGAKGWDAIACSLLDEMRQRLGAMHDSWVHAEGRRLRDLVDAAHDEPNAAQRLEILQQLAALDPDLLQGEAEIAALVRRAEALIDRCRDANTRTETGSKPNAPHHRSDRA